MDFISNDNATLDLRPGLVLGVPERASALDTQVRTDVTALLRVRRDGMTLLELGDNDDKVRVALGVIEDGTSLVTLLDSEQNFRIGLGVSRDGRPRLPEPHPAGKGPVLRH